MPVLPPLANLPTLFPSEILEKILSIPEARCAKQFGGGKKLVLGCFLLLFSGFVLFGLFFFLLIVLTIHINLISAMEFKNSLSSQQHGWIQEPFDEHHFCIHIV